MWRSRLRQAVTRAFSQGLSTRKIALSISVGLMMGTMPLVWGSCVICLAVGWWWRLSHPLIQLVNYLLYPVQIALFFPFFYWGARLFGNPVSLNREFVAQLFDAPLAGLEQLWLVNLQALVLWGGINLALFPLSYLATRTLLHRFRPDSVKTMVL
ncbi:DUF2062 domain-containing protein [Desulfuromonas acetoxidans]|uniref:DUF2062 domain-containing protein n=1 Tax=Desulfuromonas acetoxidans (strain DSM 684 / 11070) TaxID=281689 RepID=Q1K1L9_DESA6|nr:DUF2062 domain-containing protein [Desulfuromonas acetoxidans]EAT16369.1 conserved hypothetical protein [Desulfuromonas acetoxidans DSM 684]MBF0644313.1 DUF2062 domain-containing protein [Desulfuromonas acetoxidans]NVD23509.1 DUF2062 domain-containing protein [Desulfuromonas acetoxidans]NVE16105.1 DUF2062 domain-containing protein [Desulfuromonas acetoxidans]